MFSNLSIYLSIYLSFRISIVRLYLIILFACELLSFSVCMQTQNYLQDLILEEVAWTKTKFIPTPFVFAWLYGQRKNWGWSHFHQCNLPPSTFGRIQPLILVELLAEGDVICPGDTGSLVSKLINQTSSPSSSIVGYSLDWVWFAIYYKRVKLYQLIRITDHNSFPY